MDTLSAESLSLTQQTADWSLSRCVLMFSGGRDSTLSALRLNDQGYRQTLVTVTSKHLHGVEAVEARLLELRRLLPSETEWIQIEQPEELRTDVSFYEKTCLPCHHAYVVVAAAIARTLGAPNLAMGYVGYQNDWPEQTPLAIKRLSTVLQRHDVRLLLPVYDVLSREEAKNLLRDTDLSDISLEQKCSRQVYNVALSEDLLISQINLWEKAINKSILTLSKIDINVIKSCKLSEL